jgi:hypothetical protein
MRWRWSAAAILLVGVGSLGARAANRATVAEQYLFSAANAERVQRGLQPLVWDELLYEAAGTHAKEMARRESISHQYPGEPDLAARVRAAGARFSMVAENVAMAPNAVRIHDAWMNSQGHRENLLDPRATAVGIRVVSRGGELYAVEDFDRSVTAMAFEDQERVVVRALRAVFPVDVSLEAEDARRTCGMSSGFAGDRQPMFVMRYTSADLSRIPAALKVKLESGRFHEAAVGACEVQGDQNFTTYNIAVMLFP